MNTEKRLISWLLSLFLLLSLLPVAADASLRAADEPDVTFVGASLSLKGDIGLNFFITLPEEIRLDENAYMKFTTGSTIKTVPLSQGMLDASDGSYRYSIPLNAKNMGDDVTAQVYVGDTPVSDTKTLSIKFYADYMIANSSNKELVNLMKSMLNYGAAAQVNFGYDTDNLVNADMSETDRTLPANPDVSKYAHSQSGTEAGIEVTNASLLLQSETKIRIYFKLTEGKTLSDFTFTVDGKEVTPIQSGDEYYIEKTNVAAKDLDTLYTFRLGGRQLTYCGLSYVNQVMNYSKDANLLNLAKALYAYNQAANAYFQPSETEPPHEHDYDGKVTKAATCTEDGVKTFTCSCGDSYTETIKAKGHNLSEWTVTKEPTTESEGEETRGCAECDYYETRPIEKLPMVEEDDSPVADCTEHSWGNWTSDNNGSYGSCTNCGQSITVNGSNAQYASDVVTYINEYRRTAGLSELTFVELNFGRIRAEEITIQMNHSRLDGSGHGMDECIATGSNAKSVVDGWYNSSGHNGTLMREDATRAVATRCGNYWVLIIRG